MSADIQRSGITIRKKLVSLKRAQDFNKQKAKLLTLNETEHGAQLKLATEGYPINKLSSLDKVCCFKLDSHICGSPRNSTDVWPSCIQNRNTYPET